MATDVTLNDEVDPNAVGVEPFDEDALSSDFIDELLSETRPRGIYEVKLALFAKSDKMYEDFSKFPELKGKEPSVIKTSVVNNYNKLREKLEWPEMRCVAKPRSEKHPNGACIVINMDKYNAYQAAKADNAN